MQRTVELLLIAAIVVGSVLLWRFSSQRSRLTREQQRLEAIVGSLPIRDPAKVHIRAIPTGDPWEFAWRVHFPANYQFNYANRNGGGSFGSNNPIDAILRLRLREVDGSLFLYHQFLGGNGWASLGGGQKLLQLLQDHPEQGLEFEQIGLNGMEVIEPGEIRTLLKITLPPELQAAAKQQLDSWEFQNVAPEVEHFRFGPPGFREKEEAARRRSGPIPVDTPK